jgi:hypothetical protein
MRTRRENSARKGLRLINERKRVKAALAPPGSKGATGAPPSPGERFGKLTAVERGPDYVRPSGGRPELRWHYRCDCGASVCWKPSTVRTNLRDVGWCSCPDCYRTHKSQSSVSTVLETE